MSAGAATDHEATILEGTTETTADEVSAAQSAPAEEPMPEVVEALLDQQRALLRELQWTYQQLDTFNRNETQRVLKNLASKIASSPAVSDERLGQAENTLRKEIRRAGNYAQRVPSGFPKRFQELERRLDGVEQRLGSLEKRLTALEKPLAALSTSLKKVDRSVDRLVRAEQARGAVQRSVKRAVRTVTPEPVLRRVRQSGPRTDAGQ
ncbi:hypothetical protein Q7C18_15300 [Nesterenkonia sp. CL21]|uniref:hypothetical protein n=1 Tax=Nesterenkonia sp. CL21 TaxID=3064894 RepID=UPI00287A4D28|nr:hypothetical protein [Nesterenkonia sp. CL21]MDS2174070.1 hypothetical protein [Nesterenkonia sp. CL21]